MTQNSHLAPLRLFVAINIPGAIGASLRELAFFPPAMRPSPQLHITLNFMGQTPCEACQEVRAALGCIAMSKFEITLRGTGFFKKGSVVWAGVEYSPELAKLKRLVDEAVRLYAPAPARARPFSPHVTLGRMKIPDMGSLRQFVDKNWDVRHVFLASSFTLFKSVLTSGGPVYTPLGVYALQG